MLICTTFSLQSVGQSWTMLEVTGHMVPRLESGFMACKGKFYVLGGEGTFPVGIFDPDTQTWSEGAVPPVEMHHFQAVRYVDEIYVLGAFTGDLLEEKPLENIYIYDTNTDSWRKGDPIPEDRRRGSCGTVAYQGKIYMVGGTRDRNKGEHTNWMDSYNPRTRKWKKMPDAPRSRDDFHAAICNGKIYAAGGRVTTGFRANGSDNAIAEVDVYDIESRHWATLLPSGNLPTPRAGCTSVVIMDHLLVIGGESLTREGAYSDVEAFDVNRGKWEQWKNLKSGRQGTQAFMCVGTIFIAGGSDQWNGGTIHTTIEMLEY